MKIIYNLKKKKKNVSHLSKSDNFLKKHFLIEKISVKNQGILCQQILLY